MPLKTLGDPGWIRTSDLQLRRLLGQFPRNGIVHSQPFEISLISRSHLFSWEARKVEPCGNLAGRFGRFSILTRKVFRKVFATPAPPSGGGCCEVSRQPKDIGLHIFGRCDAERPHAKIEIGCQNPDVNLGGFLIRRRHALLKQRTALGRGLAAAPPRPSWPGCGRYTIGRKLEGPAHVVHTCSDPRSPGPLPGLPRGGERGRHHRKLSNSPGPI